MTYTLPISSFEALTLNDIPPLPVMAVGAASQYSLQTGAPTFGNYTVSIDPTDTFFSTTGAISPTVIRAATTTALAGVTYNPVGIGSYTGFAGSIDGVAIAVGDRILVKDQADQRQNGIFHSRCGRSAHP